MTRKKIALVLYLVLLSSFALWVFAAGHEEEIPVEQAKLTFDNKTTVAVEGANGGMLVEDKKFDYDGKNVVIMQITNQTDTDYTLHISMDVFDEAGEKLTTVEKEFIGFAAGYQNYFVFRPLTAFERYTYTLTATPFEGTAYASYLKPGLRDDPDEIAHLAIGRRPVAEDKHLAELFGDFAIYNTYPETVYYGADFVLFDNRGEICWIDDQLQLVSLDTIGSKDTYQPRTIEVLNFLWEERDQHELPEEWQGNISGLIAVKRVDVETWGYRPDM